MEKIFEDVQDLLEHTKFQCLVKCKCENCGIVFNTTKETVKRNQKIICSLCKRKNTNLKKYGVEFYGIFGSEEHNKSIKEKYGVENVSSLNWVIQKRKETCEKIYGGVAPACSKEIYEKMKKTCKKRFGVEFSSQSSEIKEKVKETNLKKYDVEFSSQNEEVKEKQKQTKKEKYGDEYFNNWEKGVKTLLLRYNRVFNISNYKYDEVLFDSSWELALWIYAKDHGEEIEREPCYFEYEFEGKKHKYFPDFKYKGKLIEIKPKGAFNEKGELINFWDKTFLGSLKMKIKQKTALDNNVIFWTQDDIRFALEYVKSNYGKNFLRRFKYEKKRNNF